MILLFVRNVKFNLLQQKIQIMYLLHMVLLLQNFKVELIHMLKSTKKGKQVIFPEGGPQPPILEPKFPPPPIGKNIVKHRSWHEVDVDPNEGIFRSADWDGKNIDPSWDLETVGVDPEKDIFKSDNWVDEYYHPDWNPESLVTYQDALDFDYSLMQEENPKNITLKNCVLLEIKISLIIQMASIML